MQPARLAGVLAAALVVAAGTPLLAVPAAHATAYRYWSYWHGEKGTWQFSQVGAGSWRVSEGSVEGWRFAVSPSARSTTTPRLDAAQAFDTVCEDTAPVQGTVRVALVLDFGVAADYPPGDGPPTPSLVGYCVQVPPRATGTDVLAAQGLSVRDEGGLICTIAGHPRTGCGEVVADPTTSTPTTRPGTSTRSATPRQPARSPVVTKPAGTAEPTGSGRPTAAPSTSPSATAPPGASDTAPTTTGAASVSTGTSSSSAAAAPALSDRAAGDPDAAASPAIVVGAPVEQSSDSGTPWSAVLVLVVVAALGGGAYWYRRRSPWR